MLPPLYLSEGFIAILVCLFNRHVLVTPTQVYRAGFLGSFRAIEAQQLHQAIESRYRPWAGGPGVRFSAGRDQIVINEEMRDAQQAVAALRALSRGEEIAPVEGIKDAVATSVVQYCASDGHAASGAMPDRATDSPHRSWSRSAGAGHRARPQLPEYS